MNYLLYGKDLLTKSMSDCKQLSHRFLTMSMGIGGYE